MRNIHRNSTYRLVNVEFDAELADICHECNFEKEEEEEESVS